MRNTVQSALSEAQTTPVYSHTMGWYAAEPIETATQDIDADDPTDAPFLAAQLVAQPWEGQAFGFFPRIWVSYGASIGELRPDQARELARDMHAFADRLASLGDIADALASDGGQDR
ncbi:DUF6907 domain-containing protein [Streptomyces violaceoruber]|uniref:Uncharacterized protein n=1 Tax=Streptomyces violaceoruber TaxID=1935 RepID=A0ACD4WQG3_STRVN|nr:hypothetical protein R2E43_20980 [Streptomyces violaceoruber]BDD72994.1 hypothetical protein JCM4020_36140 [Streptomyces coelicolor]